jgi:hypothetical protein
MTTRFRTRPFFRTAVFSFRECYRCPGRKNMRRFPKFRDPRFALTALQNPNIEVRSYAQLVLATQYAAPLPTRHFLIGRTAIRNARNSPENNALHFSNRLKTAICSARFSRVLRSNNHDSHHFYSIQINLTKSPL